MPELPDLTVFADNLDRRLKGKQIRTLECQGKLRLHAAATALDAAVRGQVVETVERSGKEIDLVCTGSTRLRIHLMLAGRFHLTDLPERLGDRMLTLHFSDGSALVVSDPKGLVRIALNPPPPAAPDALAVDVAYLRRQAAAKPKMTVKAFLIDQAILRGIGNAYADEILWQARIAPQTAVGRLPEAAVEALAAATREVLNAAVEEIRKIDPGIIAGEIRDFLRVHNPRRRRSPTGHPIRREKIAGKTTYFTDEQLVY